MSRCGYGKRPDSAHCPKAAQCSAFASMQHASACSCERVQPNMLGSDAYDEGHADQQPPIQCICCMYSRLYVAQRSHRTHQVLALQNTVRYGCMGSMHHPSASTVNTLPFWMHGLPYKQCHSLCSLMLMLDYACMTMCKRSRSLPCSMLY